MLRVKSTILMLAFLGLICAGKAFGVDPTHGATDFVFVPAGRPWHPIGPAKLITTWNGPFRNVGGHPPTIYMFFAKKPSAPSQAAKPLPKNLRTYHMLGTKFYYPANARPPVNPATLGYTAKGFTIADKLSSAFPNVGTLFPDGIETSSCHSKRGNYSLILGKKIGAAYLIIWSAPHQVNNVAYLPTRYLKGSLNSILDNMSYYELGGMYEIMRFGSMFYYLSRVPLARSLSRSHVPRECPQSPTDTPTGVSTPEGWTKALKELHEKRR